VVCVWGKSDVQAVEWVRAGERDSEIDRTCWYDVYDVYGVWYTG
jgi:hypothetical protein